MSTEYLVSVYLCLQATLTLALCVSDNARGHVVRVNSTCCPRITQVLGGTFLSYGVWRSVFQSHDCPDLLYVLCIADDLQTQ